MWRVGLPGSNRLIMDCLAHLHAPVGDDGPHNACMLGHPKRSGLHMRAIVLSCHGDNLPSQGSYSLPMNTLSCSCMQHDHQKIMHIPPNS